MEGIGQEANQFVRKVGKDCTISFLQVAVVFMSIPIICLIFSYTMAVLMAYYVLYENALKASEIHPYMQICFNHVCVYES